LPPTPSWPPLRLSCEEPAEPLVPPDCRVKLPVAPTI
jgi:hypothetical protein